MVRQPRVFALSAALCGGLFALTACMAPTATPVDAKAAPKSPAPQRTESAPVGDLTFDAGDALDSSAMPQWTDPYMTDSRFTVNSPDDGNGRWSYKDTRTGCIVGYWQGSTVGLPPSGSGDKALSDALLAWEYQTTVDVVTPVADDSLSFETLDAGTVATRSASGKDSTNGLTSIVAARGFATIQKGLIASVDCPAGVDVREQWTSLADDPGAFTALISSLG